MSVQAVVVQSEAHSTDKPAKTPRIPKRIVQLVELIASGKCRTRQAACEQLKLDPSYVSKEFKKLHVASFIEQQTRVALAQSQVQAAATLIRLNGEAASEHVQKDVAIHLLNIAGHKPRPDTQVSVNVEIKAGYVIDLSDKRDHPPIIDVTHD